MIQKTIHRIYFGFDGTPDPYKRYLETWKEQMPSFEIKHWDATNLPMDCCRFVSMMYQLKDHAFLSDYFRWWVLREHGGMYLDADIEIIRGSALAGLLDDTFSDPTIHTLLGIDNQEGGWYTGHSVASRKFGEMARFMCEAYEGLGHISLWRRKIFYMMSPQMAALYFATAGHNQDGMGSTPNLSAPETIAGVRLLPQEYFSPMTPATVDGKPSFSINAYTQNTLICHHFSCSWHDANSPYRQAIAAAGSKGALLSELMKSNTAFARPGSAGVALGAQLKALGRRLERIVRGWRKRIYER